jgi:hypothetical protein
VQLDVAEFDSNATTKDIRILAKHGKIVVGKRIENSEAFIGEWVPLVPLSGRRPCVSIGICRISAEISPCSLPVRSRTKMNQSNQQELLKQETFFKSTRASSTKV